MPLSESHGSLHDTWFCWDSILRIVNYQVTHMNSCPDLKGDISAHLPLGPLCILCFICLLSRALTRSYAVYVVLGSWEPRQKLQLQEDVWAEPSKQENEGASATASGHYLLIFLWALSCIVICPYPGLSLKLWLLPAPIRQSWVNGCVNVATLHSIARHLCCLCVLTVPHAKIHHSLWLPLLALLWSQPWWLDSVFRYG